MLAGDLALTMAAVFTGAAIYINIAEQARLRLSPRRVEAGLQAGLHDAGEPRHPGRTLRAFAFITTLDWRWLLGAIVLFANWPYTIYVVMPTNRLLMDTLPDAPTAEPRRLIKRWGALHAGRSALGLVAAPIFLWAQR